MGTDCVWRSPAGDGMGLRSEFGPGEEGVGLYGENRHSWAKWVRWCLGKGPLEDGADGGGGWGLWVRVGPGEEVVSGESSQQWGPVSRA